MRSSQIPNEFRSNTKSVQVKHQMSSGQTSTSNYPINVKLQNELQNQNYYIHNIQQNQNRSTSEQSN